MAVERFTPSATYQQNELARIQQNLANAIDDLQKQVAALKKQLGIK